MEHQYFTAASEMPHGILYPDFLLDMKISSTAKLLYIHMLDRVIASGRKDCDGRIWIRFTIREQMAVLSRSDATIKRAMLELEQCGLLVRKR